MMIPEQGRVGGGFGGEDEDDGAVGGDGTGTSAGDDVGGVSTLGQPTTYGGQSYTLPVPVLVPVPTASVGTS